MNSGNGMKITSGKEWRKKANRSEVCQLPSGCVAELKKPDILDLMLDEETGIPDLLMAQMFAGTGTPATEDVVGSVGRISPLLKQVCISAFVNPRIVAVAEADDEITIEDVEFQDRMWVLNWVMGDAAGMIRFPGEQARDIQPVSDE